MKVLIITGAPGVGKSTMSKLWAIKNEGAVIECDYFSEWIYKAEYRIFDSNSPKDDNLIIELTVSAANKYLVYKIPIAIERVWNAKEIRKLKTAFKKMQTKLKRELNVSFVYLVCSRNENHRRDELRKPEDQMKTRVDIVNGELESEKFPKYVKMIDSTHLSEAETLQKIEETFVLKVRK